MLIEKSTACRGAVPSSSRTKSDTTTRPPGEARGRRAPAGRGFRPARACGRWTRGGRGRRPTPRSSVRRSPARVATRSSERPPRPAWRRRSAGPWADRGSRRGALALARAKAIEHAPDPPPTSSIRRTPSAPTGLRRRGCRWAAPRCMAAMKGTVQFVAAVRHLRDAYRVTGADGVGERGPSPPQAQVVLEGVAGVVARAGRQEPRAARARWRRRPRALEEAGGDERVEEAPVAPASALRGRTATAAAAPPSPTAVKTSSSRAVRRTRRSSMNARSGTMISSGTTPAASGARRRAPAAVGRDLGRRRPGARSRGGDGTAAPRCSRTISARPPAGPRYQPPRGDQVRPRSHRPSDPQVVTCTAPSPCARSRGAASRTPDRGRSAGPLGFLVADVDVEAKRFHHEASWRRARVLPSHRAMTTVARQFPIDVDRGAGHVHELVDPEDDEDGLTRAGRRTRPCPAG